MRRQQRRPFPKAVLGLALLIALLLAWTVAPQGEDEAREAEIETFVPSEELPADSAISFPVDI